MVGLILNAFGNGLCITSNMGSGIWTAAAVNLNEWLGINVGVMLFIFGVLNATTNLILIKRLDVKRFVAEVLYITFFSYFVDVFTNLLTTLGVQQLPMLIRTILSFTGVACFCVAISLYQRANIVMHPNDDTTNILRFMYLKGNSTAAQIIDFVPPIIIVLIAFIATRSIYAVNVGTLFSILLNGVIIAEADKLIWPSLKHNFKAHGIEEQ
ncbi:hypothetical protein M5C72_08865 [Companilactobacillus allii]|uniref:Sugar specific permease n=1 Tax=Companilactobacillus allii TaxID=1847728 RepID=A0A1P8Q6E5_9LACO|nr:hypothetical protein [Companilactobacillus allii]APX73420.1 hypothetical protein BTM29_11755 [Companilactobacillus allii]USQ69890.1 hypothetical protein M5C72_08865 [Companilactobacillus allii]